MASASNERGSSRAHAYYPRLDGLRAVAVLLVFAEHFTYSDLIRGWAPGTIGVRTFFVLSGFLITTILLNERDTGAPVREIARRFYWRRVLRLAPVYYLAIAIAAMFGVGEMREAWWVHSLYLSNVEIALRERWTGAGHFWTLSVEEQFYLIWFPLVVLAPRRWLLPAVFGALLAAPLFRAPVAFGMSEFYVVLLPGQVDSLAAGALTALATRRPELKWLDGLLLDRRLMWALIGMVFILSIPLPKDFFLKHPFISWVITPMAISFAAACVVRRCVAGEGRDLVVLQHPWLMHIGRISYGLYVIHYFVPQFIYMHVPGLEILNDGPLKIVRSLLWIIITIIAAELSWRLIERPILRLKNAPKPSSERSRGRTP